MTDYESRIPDQIHLPIIPQSERFDLNPESPIEPWTYPQETPPRETGSPYASLVQTYYFSKDHLNSLPVVDLAKLDRVILNKAEGFYEQFKAAHLTRLSGACGMSETVERPAVEQSDTE